MVKNGRLATLVIDKQDSSKFIKDTGSTAPDTLYRIVRKGAGSALPLEENYFFFSPKTGTQFDLVTGDVLQPIAMNKMCRTNASWSTSQGTIDTSTDCNPGSSMLDGIKKTTGTIEGFMDYDEASGKFTFVSDAVLKYFFDFIEDDGAGGYAFTPSESGDIYLICNMDKSVKDDQYETFFICPIILPGVSGNLGITEMQTLSITWEQGNGQPTYYQRLKS